jgi:hypothetical protein
VIYLLPDDTFYDLITSSCSTTIIHEFNIICLVLVLPWQFPLLAKCGALNKILTEAVEAGEDEVKLEDFPGSAECFEICAKFCYGVIITLNAYNVSAVRCGAEFLKMSETVDKGNLIYKLEVFLNTSILRGWRDSIICLQNSKDYLPWSEDLKVSCRLRSSSLSFTNARQVLILSWLLFTR